MARALTVPSVEPFKLEGDSSSLPGRWERWIKSFDYFVKGSGVTDKTQKRALLLHMVGPEVQQIFETLEDTGNDNDYDIAVEKLTNYFKPKKNISFERHKFNSECQKTTETVQEFATRLTHLSLSCEFTDSKDRIRDQIVQKCTSTTLRRKFLSEKELTLEKVLDISATYERAQDSARKIENGASGESADSSQDALQIRKRQENRFPKREPVECFNCGRKGHKAKDSNCPAKSATCNKCHKKGHFAVKCKSSAPQKQKRKPKSKRNVRSLEDPESDSDSTGNYMFTVKDKFSDLRITVTVGNVPLNMIIDSGATCNVIDINTWKFLKSQTQFKCLSHERTNKKIYAYGSKTPLKLAGTFRANIEGNGVTVQNIEFTVLDGKGQSLLGKSTAIMLDVLRVGPQVCQISTDIENAYPNLFTGIGKLKDFQLRIPIDKSVEPVVQRIRRVPYHLREKLEKKLESLEQMDIIEKVETPSQWVSPIVTVPKREDDIRVCVDMRQPNLAVKRVHHTIPTIDDVLQEMNRSKVFSKLDINKSCQKTT